VIFVILAILTARLAVLAARLAVLATGLATRLAVLATGLATRLTVLATGLTVLTSRLATAAVLAILAILATCKFCERTLHTTRGTIQRFRNADCRTMKRTPCDIHRGTRNVTNSTLRRAHYTANEARRLA